MIYYCVRRRCTRYHAIIEIAQCPAALEVQPTCEACGRKLHYTVNPKLREVEK